MTATYAQRHWPTPSSPPRTLPWVFGRELVLAGLPGAPRALQWRLGRQTAVTPRAAVRVYLALSCVALAAAAFYALNGAPIVLALAGAELLALGLALLLFARHAADRETLTLVGSRLQVEQCFGARVQRTELAADWLRIEPAAGQGSLVQLSARGQCVRVGRLLRRELRGAFARELRLALRRQAVACPPVATPPNPQSPANSDHRR